ncbi:MAG: hypothetical protein AAGA05_05280 [Pseudomonadota bacterium]
MASDHCLVIDQQVRTAACLESGHSIARLDATELDETFFVYSIRTEKGDTILTNGLASATEVAVLLEGTEVMARWIPFNLSYLPLRQPSHHRPMPSDQVSPMQQEDIVHYHRRST